MADEETLRPDVPTTNAIVKTGADANALARKIAGKLPPDELRFACVMCGWDKTLKFEPDELVALGGDITNYCGPCPECDSMTLVPRDAIMGDDFTSASERARESRKEEYSEAADVFIDKVKEEVGGIMSGSTLAQPPEEQDDLGDKGGERPDLPSADNVDPGGLKPRGEG
jgi:hypothetical protein